MMELYHDGNLVKINSKNDSLSVHAFKYCRQTGFDCGSLQNCVISENKFHWRIESCKQIFNHSTGTSRSAILLSCDTLKKGLKNYSLMQIDCRDGKTSLSKCFDFEIDQGLYFKCVELTDGPAVVSIQNMQLIVFKPQLDKNVKASELDFPFGFKLTEEVRRLQISASAVFENHIVVIVSVINKSNICNDFKVATVKLARVRLRYVHEISMFFPSEYASKISFIKILSCSRWKDYDDTHKLENQCCLGLNDGYVLLFRNGIMHVCIPLGLSVSLNVIPNFLSIKNVKVMNDILVCLTESGSCFAVCARSEKVRSFINNNYIYVYIP